MTEPIVSVVKLVYVNVYAGEIKRLLFIYNMQVAVVRYTVKCTGKRVGGGGKCCFVKDVVIVKRDCKASGNLFGNIARIGYAFGVHDA